MRQFGLYFLVTCLVASVIGLDLKNLSRDQLWKVPLAAGFTYSYGKLAYNALQIDGLKYPEAHERRLRNVIGITLKDSKRVLEVGIGKDCRLLRRGFYPKDQKLDVVGVDLANVQAKVVDEATHNLSSDSTLQILQQSIESKIPFPDQSFDAIICCLTMCSVESPERALLEMKRLLRPGGKFGYLEHVAVEANEPYKLLEFAQELFDPLQQRIADNCHLHRFTQESIREAFPGAKTVLEERFLVDSMWPVSCQACGVLII